MRIQHNIMAMSAYRNYTNNVSAMKKNLEKLSSGYKINRAGDDAAGLAISEKMRAQITGLETAQKNAKDGISLVQTAEGALTEVHDMLNRMVELATMSANGTYDDTTDRAQLQKEMDQLRSEIDRIADSANFNGIKLLNGEMDGADKITESAVQGVAVSAVNDGDQDASAGAAGVYEIDLKDLVVTNAGTPGETMTVTITVAGEALGTFTFTGATLGGASIAAAIQGNSATISQIDIDGISYNISVDGTKITLTGVSVPTTSTEFGQTDLDVELDADTSTINNGFDFSVHVKTAPEVAGTPKLAQGEFTLNAADVADGAKLTIGGETYVFAVGKDSEVKAGDGETLIDLTGVNADDPNLLKKAVEKLTQQNNAKFHITTNNVADGSTSVSVQLTEKADAVDYKTEWNLKGTANAGDGVWNKKVGSDDATTGVVTKQAAPTVTKGDAAKGLTLQIGDTADSWNQLKVNIGDMHCGSLGIDAKSISIADQTSAAKAIDKIKAAINQVSDVRGTLGATQNRLDHTINNLSVMTENIQDAESTIRDVDVAEEMMAYTKNNILIQSAQAMLAQANQVPQGVLQLLQ